MADPQRLLDPEILNQISRLDLRARQVVEGFLAGRHQSPYFGQTVEFRQHRQYTPGDDLRHLDWKVLGKQDRLYLKQYEAETNLRATLAVDLSASMKYGNGPMTKAEYAATIAASLAFLLLRSQDAVGCVTFDEKIVQTVPCRTKQNHLDSIVQTLSTTQPAKKTDLYQVLHQLAESIPRRGLIILISDLLIDPKSIIDGLRLLASRGHETILFHVLDDDELDFPFDGATRFKGLEQSTELACNPRALRDGYLEAMNEHLDKIRLGSANLGVDYHLLRTSQSLGTALAAFLETRQRTIR
jgi:uncharacterized protein (DUF58 family)